MIARILAFIRFSHTVFALPFALGSMLVAARGCPSWKTVAFIVLAMVFARTAAMLFNRLADWEIDKLNPRTAGRHKLVRRSVAVTLLLAASVAFVLTVQQINALCFALSPLALLIVFFYSLTKRFTSFSHFFLGLALAVSPVGAWLAVTGKFALPPMILALGVLLWVAGFDVIYATQDVDFDKREGLHSLVVRLGIPRSLTLAQILHALMFLLLGVFGIAGKLHAFYFASLIPIFAALIYEHRMAGRGNLDALNRAFFYSNAFVGFVFIAAIALDTGLR